MNTGERPHGAALLAPMGDQDPHARGGRPDDHATVAANAGGSDRPDYHLDRGVNGVLASYTLGERLATLPLGELRAATHDGRPDRLAVLIVAPDLASDLQFEGALRRQAATLRAVRAPYLAPLVEVGRRDATLYIVFERPAGPTLVKRLATGDAFTSEQAACLVQSLADALDAVHRRGLVHGLVAPETVFVAEDGSATLLGAGLLPAVEEAELGDAIGARVNLIYVAPEQSSGRHAVASADGYALGALAHLLLTGVAPPDAVDDADPFDDLATGAASTASDPLALLGAVLRRQINARPALRYPTCAEFAQAVAAVLTGAELPPESGAARVRFQPLARAAAPLAGTIGADTGPVRPAITGLSPLPAMTGSRPVPAPGAAPRPGPTTTALAPRPGQPSTRLRAMPPALLAAVHVMRENYERKLRSAVLTMLGGVGAFIGVFGLFWQTWWALYGLAVVVLVVARLVVAIARTRNALGRDLRAGQIREVIGPAEIERYTGRSPSHYLRLPDLPLLYIEGGLYARLLPLAEHDTEAGLWTRLMRSTTVHRIPWLTAILLSESNHLVEVRDAADQVVYRKPELRGIDLAS